MPELISFSDLIKQADLVAEKTGLYTTVGVTYLNYKSETRELRYEFYQQTFCTTKRFDTVQELQQAMDRIINPIEDVGVTLESAVG